MLYTFVLVTCIVMILLGFYALIMAIIRFTKQKSSSDLDVQKRATKQFVSGIIAAVLLFVTGVGMAIVTLFYMFG